MCHLFSPTRLWWWLSERPIAWGNVESWRPDCFAHRQRLVSGVTAGSLQWRNLQARRARPVKGDRHREDNPDSNSRACVLVLSCASHHMAEGPASCFFAIAFSLLGKRGENCFSRLPRQHEFRRITDHWSTQFAIEQWTSSLINNGSLQVNRDGSSI